MQHLHIIAGLLVACIASPTVLRAAPVLPKHITLHCAFEEGLHSARGAANPFSACGHVDLVKDSAERGSVARFRGHEGYATPQRSAMLFDGVNIPVKQGTVGMRLRCSGKRTWADGKRTWLAVLAPQVGECLRTTTDNGTGLALYKDRDNSLVLGVYQFHDKRLAPGFYSRKSGFEIAEPDQVAARVPAADLPKDGWIQIRLGWDRATGKAWLGVGDVLRHADVTYRPAPWLCLLLGTPPSIRFNSAIGFDGDIDDLCVDTRTPTGAGQAGLEPPAPVPPMAQPAGGKVAAVCLKDDPVGATYERLVRAHLDNVVRTQEEHGGWTFSAAWPSGLWILSSSVVIPYTHNYFNGGKDGNSAACAMRLLNGYVTLGETRYLEAAGRTAAALIRLQSTEGSWPYASTYDPGTRTFVSKQNPTLAGLQDHVQAHPTLLLQLLHRFTGKEEYKQAADKGLAFMLRTQNPNGSWSHHWDLEENIGEAAQSNYKNAGELNDDATQDQMTMMLAAYRVTGDVRYLSSFLRAADWIKSAFIDKQGKGWAQQYDENNNPIPARHFEPPAISLSEGAHSIPRMLMRACRITGDESYLEPCRKWRQWMLDNRVFTNDEKTKWGWHIYYDPETGEPYRMVKRKRLPANPKSVTEGGFTSVLKEIAEARKPRPRPLPPEEYARREIANAKAAKEKLNDPVANRLRLSPLAEAFNWEAGTWLFSKDAPTGPTMAPSTVRAALVAHNVFLRRQLAGQIPWDHPASQMTRLEYVGFITHLVPPRVLSKRLTPDELGRARSHIAELVRTGKAVMPQ